MLNTVAGLVGLAAQAGLFLVVYLIAAPKRGRPMGLLYAALAGVDGYALVVLGAMTVGVPWQVGNALLAVTILGTLASASMRVRLSRALAPGLALWASTWGALVIFAGILVVQTAAALLAPELSIDGQLYHGPILAQLVQHGTVWGWEAPNQYMYYTDLGMVSALNVATFTGSTWFDNGAQIPHLIILLLVVNAALRMRFTVPWVRMALAALVVSAPVIWIQPRILYVDIAYGAAVAALMVLIASAPRGMGDVLVAGIAAAAIVAIKPTGLLTGAILVTALVFVSTWRRRRSGVTLWNAVGGVIAAIAPPMVLATGFYVRNLVTFGNPVYPVAASVGPLSFPGIIDLTVFASGERGSGFIDPLRYQTFFASIIDGILHGVTKLDYDPRSGGFGMVPLLILLVVGVILLGQAYLAIRQRNQGHPLTLRILGEWRMQVSLAGLAGAVLLVQPSTFDSRYVMGPTVALMCAVLLTTVLAARTILIDAIAGALALTLASGQVIWTETHVYPGLIAIKDLRNFPAVWQPLTPGNLWGRGADVTWLPNDPRDCLRIVIQTEGGVGAGGMMEKSVLSTLPYGLYGAALCNTVDPVQISSYRTGGATTDDPLPTANYLIFNSADVAEWKSLEPNLAACWHEVQNIPATEAYPQGVDVVLSSCR